MRDGGVEPRASTLTFGFAEARARVLIAGVAAFLEEPNRLVDVRRIALIEEEAATFLGIVRRRGRGRRRHRRRNRHVARRRSVPRLHDEPDIQQCTRAEDEPAERDTENHASFSTRFGDAHGHGHLGLHGLCETGDGRRCRRSHGARRMHARERTDRPRARRRPRPSSERLAEKREERRAGGARVRIASRVIARDASTEPFVESSGKKRGDPERVRAFARGRDRIENALAHHGHRRHVLERRASPEHLAREHVEREKTECPDVGRGLDDRSCARLFGRHPHR